MKRIVRNAIKLFAETHKRWATDWGALDECAAATSDFIDYLNLLGLASRLRAKDYSFEVTSKSNPRPKTYKHTFGVSEYHSIVRTREFFIDWTARQYNSRLPFPLIILRKRRTTARTQNL